MTRISIAKYNELEANAIQRLPNLVTFAFTPVVFNQLGYPCRVKEDFELRKFIDVMQENRGNAYLEGMGGFTDAEFEQFKYLTAATHDHSMRYLNFGGGSWNSTIQSLNVLRHIQYFTNGNPCRVFELGPGSGTLGALLSLSGHSYLGMDIAQAFYLYQNSLWSALFPDRFFDLAQDSTTFPTLLRNMESFGAAFCAHIPWWDFSQLYRGQAPTVDIITCNHMLAEMHYASLAYSLKLSRSMLSKSKGPRLMIFEGWGWNARMPHWYVAQELYKHGFVIVHHDQKITIAALKEDTESGQYQPLENVVKKGEIRWWKNEVFWDEQVQEFSIPNGPVTQRLHAARSNINQQLSVKPEAITAWYKSLVGEAFLSTDDERFWNYIDHPKE